MCENYTKQISAIEPILKTSGDNKWLNWFISSDQTTRKEYLQYLIGQGLAGHWHQLLSSSSEAQRRCPEVLSLLGRYISTQQAVYYNQISVLGKLDNLLEHADIPYAVIKGAHIREVLYNPPALRPCEDIDILIGPENKFRMAQLLTKHGFKAHPDIKTITHDLSFSHGEVSVDVHWDILRPGRMKQSLTEYFLSTRIRQNGYFSLTPESTLFIMLVHPVFKKYLTTPHAYLSRLIDLNSWSRYHSQDWHSILHLCDKTGLKTAAWLTATYYELLTRQSLSKNFVNDLKPSGVKATYYNFWLKNDLPSRLFHMPIFTQILFTLPAHDTLSDSIKFIAKKGILKRESKKMFQNFQNLIAVEHINEQTIGAPS